MLIKHSPRFYKTQNPGAMKPHEIIRKVRKEKGIKQAFMALNLKMSQPNYSDIENGKTKPTPKVEKQIADLLDVPVSRFYPPEDSPENKVALWNEKINHLELLLIDSYKEVRYLKKMRAADKKLIVHYKGTIAMLTHMLKKGIKWDAKSVAWR